MRSYPFTSQVTYDDEGLPLYDRAVDSSFLRRVFAQYFSDGVFYKPTSALQVVADTGMQVAVEPGCCHIQGAIGIEDSRRTLVVQAAESLDRIDTVVARLDLSLAARDIDLYVVKGTAAASPQPPELTRDATVWELGLANLFVAKNSSTITLQRITDTRLDTTRCGMVAQTIGSLDTAPYFAQIQAALADVQSQAAAQLVRLEFDFDSWFETIKGKLGNDPATALQAQIDDLQTAVGGLPLKLSAGASVSITSAENRIDSVTVNGFTTQTGSGDPSPENIRPIKNAGQYNAISMLDGSVYTYSVTTSGFAKTVRVVVTDAVPNAEFGGYGSAVQAVSTWLPAGDSNGDDADYPHFRTGSASSSAGSLVLYIPVDVLSETTVGGVKTYLSQNPLTVAYKSTENTGKYYTGIAVEQGEDYSCEIVELQAPLHEGDTLETNVQSEYDAYAEFDGSSDENWTLDSGSTAGDGGSKRLFIKVNGPRVNNTSSRVAAVAASNNLMCVSTSDVQNAKSENCFGLAYAFEESYLYVRIVGIATAEALKTHLQSNPLRVWYKSTSGGAPLNVKREAHAKATVTVDGQTTLFTQGVDGYAVALPGASNGAVLCNAFSGLSASSQSVTIPASAFPSSVTSLETANTWAQSQNVVIEYPLSTPEVYADTPVDIDNPQGTYTVSGESGTTCSVLMKALVPPQDTYSKLEVNTGKTWIDGKPLFRRTFEIDLQSDHFSFDTGIPAGSLDTVFIGSESFCVYVDSSAGGAQTIYPASSVYSANEIYNTLFFVKPDYTATVTIDWRGGTGWGGQKAYITLYYTKK